MVLTVKGAWSKKKQSFNEFDYKKNRLITKLELFSLSEYWVEICWVEEDKVRSKEFAISTKLLL